MLEYLGQLSRCFTLPCVWQCHTMEVEYVAVVRCPWVEVCPVNNHDNYMILTGSKVSELPLLNCCFEVMMLRSHFWTIVLRSCNWRGGWVSSHMSFSIYFLAYNGVILAIWVKEPSSESSQLSHYFWWGQHVLRWCTILLHVQLLWFSICNC